MKQLLKRLKRYWVVYLMALPVVAFYFIFCYLPMGGIIVSFKDYNVLLGIKDSPWLGTTWFEQFLTDPYFWNVVGNTLIISLLKLVFCFPIPIILALLMNEMMNRGVKRTIQTIMYLPHFISWVIIGGMVILFLAPETGIVNAMISAFGGDQVYFMTHPETFKPLVLITEIWKNSGWGTIIYMAAIAGISAEQYEAAYIDGAGHWRQIWHVTLPGMRPIVIMMLILTVSNILSAGFDQIFVLKNPYNAHEAEILDTLIYSLGIQGGMYSYATAIGLFKSVIATILLFVTDRIAKAVGERGIV